MTSAPPFEEVMAHAGMIRRIAAAHEANASAREDLVQDILLALWRALPGFRGEGSLRSFVARVAANRAVTHVQRAVGRPAAADLPCDLASPDASPESAAIALDETARLAAAVRALPLGLREPALLALEGLSPAEIAGVLGLTPNAVAIRMTRARSALRNLLGA